MSELTPKQIVEKLNKYIIGQNEAKKSVAVALRNRWRSRQLPAELQEEIIPKNILMMGPTGVGKTEIARRLAKLVDAPFVKVEATKFTEVGYVGRDVESIIRDLTETSVRMVKSRRVKEVEERAKEQANERLIDLFMPEPPKSTGMKNPFEMILGGLTGQTQQETKVEPPTEQEKTPDANREYWRERLAKGELETKLVEIMVEDSSNPMMAMFAGANMDEMGMNMQDMLGGIFPKKQKKRKVNVAAARKIFEQEEANKLIDMDDITAQAINMAENNGIVFLDEIDKIASKGGSSSGPEVSREGVQRDILPIVEGSTVTTKYGQVKTEHILFIAAGAFHMSKPSDLIPELQGRFPIRVELKSLSKDDFKQILTEPTNALIMQYVGLMSTEGITLKFTDDAIEELAEIAYAVNASAENIGARRLHTVLEKLLADVAFEAPDVSEKEINVNKEYVKEKLSDIVANQDLSQFIL